MRGLSSRLRTRVVLVCERRGALPSPLRARVPSTDSVVRLSSRVRIRTQCGSIIANAPTVQLNRKKNFRADLVKKDTRKRRRTMNGTNGHRVIARRATHAGSW